MKLSFTMIAMGLLVAGCHSSNPSATSNAYAPSPHFGNSAPCPGSATSNEGGHPTPTDCVPGGMD